MSTRLGLPSLSYVLIWLALSTASARGQDLEPRRWTHLPDGMNVLAFGVVESSGDLTVDPVLMLDDVKYDARLELVSYMHSFAWLGKSARVDVRVPYQQTRWEGVVNGTPASVRRRGFGDPRIRLSVNLMGAPPLKGKEYLAYRESHPINTVVGVAVAVTLPFGEYKRDKLLNLGQNRYTIRPQIGVLHTRGPWSFELTGSAFYFTDNNEFFNDNHVEQAPLYAMQGHVVRTFSPGWWLSAGAGYGSGGRSTVNGARKDDRKNSWLSGIAGGFPVAKNQGVSITYIRGTTHADVGADSDTLIAGWSVRF